MFYSVVQANESEAVESPSAFIDRMVEKHQMDRKWLEGLFAKTQKNQRIIDLITTPAEGKPWYEYRKIFVREARINAGIKFWNEHQVELQRAESTFQVPAAVIVSIIGVETFYGKIKGNIKVMEALYTLGFHYPKRAKFFRGELEQFLILAQEQNWDPLQPEGSYAGAMGMGQFIPTSYREYAVDFDGDGKIDLFNNPADAIGSVANYFRVHKWRWGEPVAFALTQQGTMQDSFIPERYKPGTTAGILKAAGFDWPVQTLDEQAAGVLSFDKSATEQEHWIIFDNFYVITRYNRSPLYAMAVYQFSQELKARRAQSYWMQ
ncbi:MAG: lytic murein transglycosylase B [Gammaproteobacteria bacterium]|nr:lytic murein transglycosylase B [Gammaproteobacteria bacterium]NVK88542.1 lytic murein transglycosylase B [Gammaproteobacteria bacterium]